MSGLEKFGKAEELTRVMAEEFCAGCGTRKVVTADGEVCFTCLAEKTAAAQGEPAWDAYRREAEAKSAVPEKSEVAEKDPVPELEPVLRRAPRVEAAAEAKTFADGLLPPGAPSPPIPTPTPRAPEADDAPGIESLSLDEAVDSLRQHLLAGLGLLRERVPEADEHFREVYRQLGRVQTMARSERGEQ